MKNQKVHLYAYSYVQICAIITEKCTKVRGFLTGLPNTAFQKILGDKI